MLLAPVAAAVLSCPGCSELLATQEPAPAAPDFPAADAVLDAMERRERAAATIERIDTMVLRGRVEFVLRLPSPQKRAGTFVEHFSTGGRSRFRMTLPSFYEMDSGCDGEVVWEIDPTTGVVVKEGEDRAIDLRLAALSRGESWRAHYQSARTVGWRELDGAPHVVIEMTPRAGGKETWYVRREPAELGLIELRMNMGAGSREDVKLRFLDREAVDGVLHAKTMRISWGVIEITFRYDSIEHNVEIEDELFALPQRVAEVVAAGAKGEGQADSGGVAVSTVLERRVASIRIKIKPDAIGQTISAVLPEVFAVLEERGLAPSGPPFSRYHSLIDDEIDLEAGFPVGAEFEGKGRVQAGTLPGGRVVTLWHEGPYERLGDAHGRLATWVAAHNLEASGPQWEVYWTNPGTEPEPAKWRTQIFCPVK